jgi:hypothetical protein
VPKIVKNDRMKENHKNQVKIKGIKAVKIKRGFKHKYDKNGKRKEYN